jgi:copper transport protein
MGRARPAALLLASFAVVSAFAAAFLFAERAHAHAVLERSVPAQDERLQSAPALVQTFYSEPLERRLTELEVLNTQGTPVHTGETIFSDEDPYYAAIALPADLGAGIYTVTYRNVSTVDGHQWTGSFSFIILNEDGSVPAGTAFEAGGGGQGYLPAGGDGVLRWLALVAAVALGGAAAFYLLVARPGASFLEEEGARRIETASMTVIADMALLAVPVLVFAGAAQLGLLADRLGGPEAIDDILFHTRTGALWLARNGLALVVLLAFAPALLSERWRSGARANAVCALALLAALSVLMMYSLGSHASAGGGEFWAVGADFVHFAATAAWLGAMLQLPLVFWWTRGRLEGNDRLIYVANVFDRFSWVAVISLTVLLGTGLFNGFVELPEREALWETTYGRVLIAKLSLILPLLGMAGINAFFLKPALVNAIDVLHGSSPEEPAEAGLRARLEARLQRLQRALPRTVAAEFLLGVAVLVSVSILAQTTPAESELSQASNQPEREFEVSAQADDLNATLNINPFQVGVNTFTLTLRPRQGAELGEVLQAELRAFFDDPSASLTAGQSGNRQVLTATDQPGVYTTQGSLLSQPGDWRLRAVVRRRGIDDAQVDFAVPQVGGVRREKAGMFDLPFDFVDWNIVAGGALIVVGLGVTLIWYNRPPGWRRAVANSVVAGGGAAMVAGAVFLFGVDVHEVPVPSTSPVPPNSDSLATGQRLWEMNCRVCHGPNGDGDGPQAASLPKAPPPYNQHVPYHSDGTLWLWISEGLPLESEQKNMPPFKDDLTEDERWHIVNFLRATWGEELFTPVLPEDTPEAGTPAPATATSGTGTPAAATPTAGGPTEPATAATSP